MGPESVVDTTNSLLFGWLSVVCLFFLVVHRLFINNNNLRTRAEHFEWICVGVLLLYVFVYVYDIFICMCRCVCAYACVCCVHVR